MNKTQLISKEKYESAKQELDGLKHISKQIINLNVICHSYEKSISSAQKLYGISRVTIYDIIKKYQNAYKKPDGRGRPRKLDEQGMQKVKEYLTAHSQVTGLQLQEYILQNLGVKLSLPTINRLQHELGFSYITARPQHKESNPDLQDGFKKKYAGNSQA